MPVIHFIQDYDYTPSDDPNITYGYKAGSTVDVPEECADRALAKGRAVFPDIAEDDLFDVEKADDLEEADEFYEDDED